MSSRCIIDRGGFKSYFDDSNGDYMRTNILDEDDNDTGIEPFCSEFPQLLDIGIMGHCEHGLSGLCTKCGIECYQSGSKVNEPNISLEDFKSIIKQCEGRTFQAALGGRGDPEMHENFEDILAVSRFYGVVPNITTSGYGLNHNHVDIIKKYCGAAAVSWYNTPYTFNSIKMLLDAGITTNIHFVLGNNSIDEAIDILSNNGILKGVSRVIFLLHKPVGMGGNDRILRADDKRVKNFFRLFSDSNLVDKVGFDSCLVPGVVSFCPEISPNSYDACEAGRFSAYIGADLEMCPCSFDKTNYNSESLYKKSISEVWNGKKFKYFRRAFLDKCPSCSHKGDCLGGCPITPDIRLCGKVNDFK